MAMRSFDPIRPHRFLVAFALMFGPASFALASDLWPIGATTGQLNAAPTPELAAEAPYLTKNRAAMTKMMDDMAVNPTGDVDRDFVAMMIPHHQGAIDMAQAVLRYGHNEQLKRLAQEIIVTQQQEITAMRLAVGDPLPPSGPSPTQPSPAPAHDHKAMSGAQ